MFRTFFGLLAISTMIPGPLSPPIRQPNRSGPTGLPGALGKETGDENHPGDVPHDHRLATAQGKADRRVDRRLSRGGYGFLATDHEGRQVAEWLNSVGIAAVMVKYRLAPKYKHPAPLMDAQRAIRTVRAKSKQWGLDPKRVGILGFSAGGHLASTAATHFDEGKADASDPIDRESCRPDAAVLVYPVISFTAEFAHKGSADNLLGKDASKEALASLSNETQVTDKTPPCFLAHTAADTGVPPENSVVFAMALRKANVPFELHIFEKGQHGLGLGTGWATRIAPEPSFQAWPKLCESWLKTRGFLDKS